MYGGGGSGKSFFFAQYCVLYVLMGGRNFLITRAVEKTIRDSFYAELRKAIRSLGVSHLFNIKSSPMIIECKNEYCILFRGLDDVEKVKGITPSRGQVTDIIMEEATECKEGDLDQLYVRQRGGDESVKKRLFILLNPIVQSHWIYKKFFEPVKWNKSATHYISDSILILKTWYVHNKFLTAQDISRALGRTGRMLDVYTYGNWGVLGDTIYTNYEIRDLTDMLPHFNNTRYGLDFGWAAPTAMVLTNYDKEKKTIYVFDEVYQVEMQNDDMIEAVKSRVGKMPVFCDYNEGRAVQELRKNGVTAIKAKKGRDSVVFGIKWLQGHTMIVDPKCVNFISELQSYKHKTIRGEKVEQPEKVNDHLLDALRYAYERDMTAGVASVS